MFLRSYKRKKNGKYNWLQCYSNDSLRNEFEENGFKIEELYSDVAGKPFTSESAEIAIVAKKTKKYEEKK